jgi:uncharacterized protein
LQEAEVDPEMVSVVGFSEGTTIVPKVAIDKVNNIVLMGVLAQKVKNIQLCGCLNKKTGVTGMI